MSTFKGMKEKHRVLSATAYTREAMGGNQHGLCVRFSKNAEGS
jgi:hypothetical protein